MDAYDVNLHEAKKNDLWARLYAFYPDGSELMQIDAFLKVRYGVSSFGELSDIQLISLNDSIAREERVRADKKESKDIPKPTES